MAMAAAGSDLSSENLGEGWQDMVDCPVCLSILSRPKFLSCGHCVCDKCEQRMIDESEARVDGGRSGISCPKCRKRTFVPAGGLAVNYVLQDVISFCQQKKEKDSSETRYVCVPCGKNDGADEMWLCKTCNSMFICGTCACKAHRDHDIHHVSQIIDSQKKLINDWKDTVGDDMHELKMDADGLTDNVRDVQGKLNLLAAYLTRDAQRWMTNVTKPIIADVNTFDASFGSLTEDLVGGDDSVGIADIQPKLQAKKQTLNDLKKRHRQVVVMMTSVKGAMGKFQSDLTQLGMPPAKERKRHAQATPTTSGRASPMEANLGNISEIELTDSNQDDMSSSEEAMDVTRSRHIPTLAVSSSDSDSDNSTRATNGSCIHGVAARARFSVPRGNRRPVALIATEGASSSRHHYTPRHRVTASSSQPTTTRTRRPASDRFAAGAPRSMGHSNFPILVDNGSGARTLPSSDDSD